MDARRPFDLAAGVADLRVLDVRYFVASAEETIAAADASPDLRRLATTDRYQGRIWKVYEVPDSQVVETLGHDPVVVPGIDGSRRRWEAAVLDWYDSGTARQVVLAADGPRS